MQDLTQGSGDEGPVERVRTVWVLASGPFADTARSMVWLPRPDRIVAADGGTALAARLGMVPDLVIGDLDSSSEAAVEDLRKRGVEFRLFEDRTKWETDTELAVLAAVQWRPERILVLGAMGGRIDHTFANLMLLTHPGLAGEDVRIIDGKQEIFLAKPGKWNDIEGQNGDTVSLVPVGGPVKGVRNRGLEYPLDGETLGQGSGRGVSNSIVALGAGVWLESGLLYVAVLHAASEEE